MSLDLCLPLRIRATTEAFGITDAAGLSVAWIYFDDGCSIRRRVRSRMTREQAEAVAKAMARALTAAVEAGQEKPRSE